MCNRTHQHLCTRKKSQTLAAKPLFGHTKTLHTLVEMGTELLLWLLCLIQARRPDFPQGTTEHQNKQKKEKCYWMLSSLDDPSFSRGQHVSTARLITDPRLGVIPFQTLGTLSVRSFDVPSTVITTLQNANCHPHEDFFMTSLLRTVLKELAFSEYDFII